MPATLPPSPPRTWLSILARVAASLLFLLGLLLAWGLLSSLQAVGWAIAGLKTTSAPQHTLWILLVPWFVYAYFVVSAVAVVATGKKRALVICAVLAHALLLCALIGLAFIGSAEKGFFSAFVVVLQFTLRQLALWIGIWIAIIVTAKQPEALVPTPIRETPSPI